MRLLNKVAIVTGAGRGMGESIALLLAEEGADVVICDIIEERKSVAKSVESLQRRALPIKCDVSKSDDVDKMVRRTIGTFGKIDILVNNAGIAPEIGNFIDIEEKYWDVIFNVNAKGVFLCCKAVAPHMIKQRSGKIVNISSMAGKTGASGQATYSASKAAVITFTRAIAKELGEYNINVNVICPGIVPTKMHIDLVKQRIEGTDLSVEEYERKVASQMHLKRTQSVKDIANAVLFLVSEDSMNITGEALNVSGGLEMR